MLHALFLESRRRRPRYSPRGNLAACLQIRDGVFIALDVRQAKIVVVPLTRPFRAEDAKTIHSFNEVDDLLLVSQVYFADP